MVRKVYFLLYLVVMKLWGFYILVRWGGINDRVLDYIQYTICEVEYTAKRSGKVIGYWAYGSYNPDYPYQGCPDWIEELRKRSL